MLNILSMRLMSDTFSEDLRAARSDSASSEGTVALSIVVRVHDELQVFGIRWTKIIFDPDICPNLTRVIPSLSFSVACFIVTVIRT